MKHQHKIFKYLLLFIGILFYTQAHAQRYVDASATGANNGTSWADAYTSLQSAISGATAGTQIYVAKGTYKPTNGTNRNATFQIPSGVEIYGGFSGKETRINQVLLDARDFVANETILSGDLNGDDNVTGTFPTLVYGNYADNSVHLIYTRNVSNATRLDGFTIKGGNANDGSASFDYGIRAGGWYNNGSTGGVSQPTVANCIFTRNIGSEGGAMTNFGCCGGNANATIINCSFTQNQAAKGGAIYNDACCGGRANTTVTNCSFSQNRATNQGGGIYNEGVAGGGARATVTNSIFWENAGTRKSWFNASGGAVTASYTLVEEAAFPAGTTNNGNNLFNQDPLFVNAAIGNLNLQTTSPMINIGNNAVIPTDITLDAGNSPRVRATTVDLGAFETCPPTSAEINVQGNGNDILDGAGIPDILVSNNTDFGLVPVTRTITYTIRNTGGAVLSISSILSSNTAEYTVSNIPTSVTAGGTATFDVTFTPIPCGDNNATIVVNTNDCDEAIYNFVVQGIGGNPEINIQGNSTDIADGDVTPVLADDTDFGNVATNRTVTYTIENTGSLALDITSIAITGANAADFVLSGITLPTSIAAAGTTTFDVIFTPAAVGIRNATITINNNDCDEGVYNFSMRGTGTASPEINLQGNGNNIVSGAGTTSLTNDTDFGDVAECGTNNLAKTYAIQNTGGTALTVSNITITGADAADFTLSGLPAFPATVAATTGTQTFTVTFNPSAIGNRVALVTVTNDDSDENPYTFAINGNGTADNIDPIIPVLADINEECSSTPTASTTTDNCAGTITGTTPTTFPITTQGTTVVTWTFDDGNGNSVTADQNVIIDDTTDPVIPVLADINEECSSTPTAPTTTDNCAGTITGTTPTTFPITAQGTTVVTWTFDDGNGNSVTADQNVIIDDTTDPVIPVLADINEECSSTPTAPTTTDNCGGTITGTTGTTFPITAQGTTVVTWTFDDGNGNSVTADQNVIIDDTTDPVIPVLADINEECSSTPTAPTTTDNCAGTITGTTPTTFPITAQGTTVVTWTFDDGNGNSITADQDVIINDTTDPTITAPTNVTINTDAGLCTASGVALGTSTGTDNCGTPTFTNDAPATFPIGNTTVTWTADDGNGNTQTATQIVTVNSTREINVQGNSVSIVDGDVTPDVTDETDFGNTAIAKTVTYTIENTGTEDLDVSSITSSNMTDFTVGSIPTSVPAGGSATFDVTFTAVSTGTNTATITINNNDCDETAYDFVVEGANTSSGDVLLVRTGIFYPTIQQAVDAAIANDVIKPTSNRNYPENVVVDKTLSFTSDFTDYKNVNINQILVEDGNKLTITGDMSIVEMLYMEVTAEVEVTGSTTDFALLSSATGTAMIINNGTNTVNGNVIAERYLPSVSDLASGYDAQGYHMFSSPFSDAAISQFGDDMNLVLNTAYNTATEPTYTNPFPTFYEYDETSAGTPSPSGIFNAFTIGYKVPTTVNLGVGKGYEANIATGVTVDLNGTLNNGNISIPITHQGLSYANEGFNLIGNPYPSPINWTTLIGLAGNNALVNDAVYIDIPTSQYGATYATFINGASVNGGKADIAPFQGFFVQAIAAGNLNITNAVRPTTYTDSRFYKTNGETGEQGLKEGLIKLAIEQNGKLDETAIYFESGATQKFDGKFDALKIHKINGSTPTLYSYNEGIEENGQNTYFSINGLKEFNEDMILPLAMNIVKSGKHKIVVREIKYFHSLSNVYLYDSLTETLHDLKANPEYEFVAQASKEVKRFVILFKTDKNFTQKDYVVAYPNPTPNQFSYSLKNDREGVHTIRLFDATGKLILERTQDKQGAFLEGTINLEKEASGLYLLQISDSKNTTNVRIVKE
ncbi:choice-of-anchor D domain-containing protein [Bernardetia sp. OM2101]|uniref:choice-of-anchor D domain-containing protein n=1 Tax=Bernardetia sp. OM2101 TaxID=3344876 RepID=UPI0035CEDAF6